MSLINSLLSNGRSKEYEYRMHLRFELIDSEIDRAIEVHLKFLPFFSSSCSCAYTLNLFHLSIIGTFKGH